MKLLFPESKLAEMKRLLTDNPTSNSVQVTQSEFIAIYDELVREESASCVTLSSHRTFWYNGREIKIQVLVPQRE